MKYPRVNLIKKNELRYQGVVSRGFILTLGIGAPAVLVLVLLAFFVVYQSNLKAQLESARIVWENYEPRLNDYREDKSGLTTTGQIMDLFDGWQASQKSFLTLLEEVQQNVPENIQFTRLSVRSELGGPVYKKPEDLALNLDLTIDGMAVGDGAERDVILLQKKLKSSAAIGSSFASLKLASMRKSTAADNQAMRQFRLTGSSQEGED